MENTGSAGGLEIYKYTILKYLNVKFAVFNGAFLSLFENLLRGKSTFPLSFYLT